MYNNILIIRQYILRINMAPYNDRTYESECCTCSNLSDEDFSIDLNKDKIKIIIKQDSNIVVEEILKKRVLDGRIVYKKKKVDNKELSIDKDITVKIYDEEEELCFGMIFSPNTLNIVNDNNRKYCYAEYMPNKAITFNLTQIENNKILISSVYLSYKT